MTTLDDTYLLDITWEKPGLPPLVGPFSTRAEANQWAALNIPNGSFEVRPLAWPYLRSNPAAIGGAGGQTYETPPRPHVSVPRPNLT
jgi:hypothetical protein